MYGQTVTIGRFSVFVCGLPNMTEQEWIARAKEQLIAEIKRARGRV